METKKQVASWAVIGAVLFSITYCAKHAADADPCIKWADAVESLTIERECRLAAPKCQMTLEEFRLWQQRESALGHCLAPATKVEK